MSFNPDKAEIFLFSNTDRYNVNFSFNGNNIPITMSHKHLGVTLSSDEVKNSKGPKTDPWGTPAETSQTVDDVALLITFCFL
jgi:hypothetical protein